MLTQERRKLRERKLSRKRSCRWILGEAERSERLSEGLAEGGDSLTVGQEGLTEGLER